MPCVEDCYKDEYLLMGIALPDLPLKLARSNYDPVLELYYYKSIWEPDPRTKKWETTLQESMGARGVQTLDANFDKSFVTPVWNFVVVSPGTIFWNNWGGNGGSKPLTRPWINLLSRLCGILWSCPQALFPKITQAGGFLVESICMCFVFVASWSLTHVPANLSWRTSNRSSLRGYT